MSTISSSHDADLRRLDTEFLDLVLADEDLLRAEFDAIIQATWSPPPASPPASPSRCDRPGRRGAPQPRSQPRNEIEAAGGLESRRSPRARQRSPPSEL